MRGDGGGGRGGDAPGLERLWAPWRLAYVTTADTASHAGRCFICEAAEGRDTALVVETTALTVSLLNRFPYNSGHLMVCPRRHIPDVRDASAAEGAELFEAGRRAVQALSAIYRADGFNLGINQGGVAGGTVADHLHIHVVPRWNGDTNFMPVVAGTKVLPEALEESASRLRTAFAALRDG